MIDNRLITLKENSFKFLNIKPHKKSLTLSKYLIVLINLLFKY